MHFSHHFKCPDAVHFITAAVIRTVENDLLLYRDNLAGARNGLKGCSKSFKICTDPTLLSSSEPSSFKGLQRTNIARFQQAQQKVNSEARPFSIFNSKTELEGQGF